MKKRILSLFLCLVLCLTLIPATAVLAAEYEEYNVWVADEQFTSDKLTITCGSGTATYNPDTKKLTLNNAIISNTSNPAIKASDALDIVIVGDVSVTGNSTNAIISDKSVTISGDGKLTVNSTVHSIVSLDGDININCQTDITSSHGYVVFAVGNVTIKNTLKIAEPTGAVVTGGHIKVGETFVKHIIIAPKPPCSHSETEGRNAAEATCTEDGYTGDTYCVACDELLSSGAVILALGHIDANSNGKCDRCDADVVIKYNVWVAGEQFASDKLTITCGTGTATYNPDTRVLILNNAQIVGSGSGKGIESNEIITISLIGENTIDNFDDGINSYVTGDVLRLDNVSLVGTGKLTMTNVLGGILVNRGGLAITDSVTVEIVSTKPSAPAAGLYVRSGALTIDSDSTVNITSAYTGAHVGYNVRIADNASVNITAANSGYGIQSGMYDIEFLDNVTVTIQSSSHGVYTSPYGKVRISGGTIDVESESKTAIKAKDGIIIDSKCEMVTPENGVIAAMTDGDYAGSTIVLDGENPAKHVVFDLKCTHVNTEIRNAVEATCTEDGYTGDTYCKDCGELILEGETEIKKSHAYATEWSTDDTNHWHVCTVCGAKKDNGAHVDLDKNRKCDTCNTDTGSAAEPDDDITRIVIEAGIKNIPTSLVEKGLDTEEKIIEKMFRAVTEELEGYTTEKTEIMDVVFQMSLDGGTTWVAVTPDNFPTEGLVVTIPYPEGTNAEDYDFAVSHMVTVALNGLNPGDVETPAVTKTSEGIQFTVKSLSPIGVSWKALEGSPNPGNGDVDAGSADNRAWLIALLASFGVCATLVSIKRKREEIE